MLSSDEELLSFRCVNGVMLGVVGDGLGDSGAICSSELILLAYCGQKTVNTQLKITVPKVYNVDSRGRQSHRQEQVSEKKKGMTI